MSPNGDWINMRTVALDPSYDMQAGSCSYNTWPILLGALTLLIFLTVLVLIVSVIMKLCNRDNRNIKNNPREEDYSRIEDNGRITQDFEKGQSLLASTKQ